MTKFEEGDMQNFRFEGLSLTVDSVDRSLAFLRGCTS